MEAACMDYAILASASVHPMTTGFFALMLVALITCLALEERIHAKKSIIAGLFAVLALGMGTACGILDFSKVLVGSRLVEVQQSVEVSVYQSDHVSSDLVTIVPNSGEGDLHLGGEEVAMPVYIPGIDWAVIAIILGSSLFVDVTSRSGVFSWVAIRVTKLSRGDPVQLYFLYGTMTVVFSAVLNNVTAMIIVGSLTVVSLDRLGKRNYLLAFLLTEGLLTNIGGLLTLISSVPNILVGTAAKISFTMFFVKSAPYVLVTTIATLYMGIWLFEIKGLKTIQQRIEAQDLVSSMNESDGIQSQGFFWFSTSALIAFIVLIALTSAIPGISDLGMGYVALAFAAIMLWRFKSEVNQFYQAVDWDLLGFFMALFVVIYVMEHANVLGTIGFAVQSVLANVTDAKGGMLDGAVLLCGAAGFSSVTDNIPLAAMLSKILEKLGTPTSSNLWWSVVFGANLGGNLTPIGSASTLVAMTIIHKQKLPLDFVRFIKLAFPFAAMHILVAVVYVVVILRLFP